jgi:hypothetical protein
MAQTITFEEIRERVARGPQPIGSDAVLTPIGHASVSLYRLRRQLADLEPAERAEMLCLVAEAIRPMIAELAAGA